MKKLFGFTLAEVLITLGVIGVVAAMTIPTLMKNYRRHLVETRVKHTYATISQVFRQAQVDNGEMYGWDLSDISGDEDKQTKDSVYNFISTYMLPYMTNATVTTKKMTNKEFGYNKGIYDPYAKTYDNFNTYFITLNNGVLLQPKLAIVNGGKAIASITIYFDIDGLSGQNTWGKDVFGISIIPATGEQEMTGETLTFYTSTGLPAEKGSRSTILKYCKTTGPNYCGALIKWDGWKISNDYPWL